MLMEQIPQDLRELSVDAAEDFTEILYMHSRRVEDGWRNWDPGGIHQRNPNGGQWGSQVRKSFHLIVRCSEVEKCIHKDVGFW